MFTMWKEIDAASCQRKKNELEHTRSHSNNGLLAVTEHLLYSVIRFDVELTFLLVHKYTLIWFNCSEQVQIVYFLFNGEREKTATKELQWKRHSATLCNAIVCCVSHHLVFAQINNVWSCNKINYFINPSH